MMGLGGVCVMGILVVRVLCDNSCVLRVMRMLVVGVLKSFAAMRFAAEQSFQVASRNARHPKHHTHRRNNAEGERKFWLAVRHVFSLSVQAFCCHCA